MSLLGETVKAKRNELKWSVRDTAAECGVSAATISRVENDELPDIPTLAKLCVWLDTSPAFFMDENGLK